MATAQQVRCVSTFPYDVMLFRLICDHCFGAVGLTSCHCHSYTMQVPVLEYQDAEQFLNAPKK